MYELKRCPFCGSEAKMRTIPWPEKIVGLFESKAAAQEFAENYDPIVGTVIDIGIYQKHRFSCGKGRVPGKWVVWAQLQGFIPSCTKSRCIGENDTKFLYEEEAAAAWNERFSDV